ncbi:MAG TPA: cell division protein FtsL, partial [Candidatus Kapabacteria bacterium]|nr:cell division protein FtsL [Candidatus Kapabacteria bacterium]
MTTIAFAPRTEYGRGHQREMLGVKSSLADRGRSAEEPFAITGSEPISPEIASIPKAIPGEIEKAVRRMPVLYVIAFFGVVVLSAVMIIWNTLQVNKLSAEKTTLDNTIALNQQRLIRMRAEEMQLSAPDRIRAIAQMKYGMVEANGQDIVIVK